MLDWLLSTLWYGSALGALLGLLALVRPIRWLRLPTRTRSATLLVVSLALLGLNARAVPRAVHVMAPVMLIDDITPAFQFRERHTRTIASAAPRVIAAIKGVTAGDIAFFQTFTSIRRFGRAGPESILNAPEHQPILEVAIRSGFLLLAESEQEIVIGTIVAVPARFRPPPGPRDRDWFQQLTTPGVVKATMNFHVTAGSPSRTTVTTETRVFANDESGLRRFTPYWRTIFPGSWILRATWLQAIARRAEA